MIDSGYQNLLVLCFLISSASKVLDIVNACFSSVARVDGDLKRLRWQPTSTCNSTVYGILNTRRVALAGSVEIEQANYIRLIAYAAIHAIYSINPGGTLSKRPHL